MSRRRADGAVRHLPAAVLEGHHVRRRRRAAALPRRARRRRAVRLAAAGVGRRVQPRLRRGRPHPDVRGAGRRGRPAGRWWPRCTSAVSEFVLDIVPNHVGVDVPQANPWWWDVLAHGRSSRYASYFDIDWGTIRAARSCCRSSTPTRRRPSPSSTLSDDRTELRYYEHAFPVAPGTGDDGHPAGGARAPALPAGLLEARRRRADLPAVLRRLHARRGAGRGPGGVRGHPPRGAALGGRGRGRRPPRRPPRRAVRSRRVPAPAAGGDRARPLAARGEDPRRRRDAAGVVAGRRHVRLRGAARDPGGVRRPGRGRAAHPVRGRAHGPQGVAARGRARRAPRGGRHDPGRGGAPDRRGLLVGAEHQGRARPGAGGRPVHRGGARRGRGPGAHGRRRAALRLPGLPLLPAGGAPGARDRGLGGPHAPPRPRRRAGRASTPRCWPTRTACSPPACSRRRAW